MPTSIITATTIVGLARIVGLGMAGLALSGCMTTRVEETKNAKTGIAQDERIVILEASYHNGNETEDEFVDCVSKSVQKGRNGLNVYPDDAFIDALFPWFEPRTAPQGIEALPVLLDRPGVNERIRESGVRYIVWVTGDTERSASGGSLSCAVSPSGGGCFGLAWWENDSSYAAAVWDIRDGKSAGEVSADVQGTSVIPAVIVPVPLIARTKNAACKGLARELKDFIVDSGPL
jgi:hypothetical protein